MSERAIQQVNPEANASVPWVTRAERALRGSDDDDGSVEVLIGQPPPIIDAQGSRALLSPVFAAFLISAALFLDPLRGPLDPLSLLVRLLAVAITLRTLLQARTIAQRLRLYANRHRYRLAIADDGLLLRTPSCDIAIAKDDIIDIVAESFPEQAREAPVFAHIFLITKPQSGRTFVALPPVFTRLPRQLLEQLQAWRGEILQAGEDEIAEPMHLYRRQGLSLRGPYATVLLGLVLLDGLLRLPEEARGDATRQIGLVAFVCIAIVPLVWTLAERFRLGAPKRPLLSITGTHIGFAARSGRKQLSFAQITKIETLVRSGWSLLRGAHLTRTLSIGSFAATRVRFEDDTLQLPVDVVCALCEAYRHQRIRSAPQ